MDEIKAARLALKWQLQREWPGTRCACGEDGATDLGHIVYTRHPDTVELYHPYNMMLLHNSCNTNERLWVNVNACLVLLERAGGAGNWVKWARTIPRKGNFWIPDKMYIAMDLYNGDIRAFELDKIKGSFLTSDGGLQQLDDHIEWLQRWNYYDNRPLGEWKGGEDG